MAIAKFEVGQSFLVDGDEYFISRILELCNDEIALVFSKEFFDDQREYYRVSNDGNLYLQKGKAVLFPDGNVRYFPYIDRANLPLGTKVFIDTASGRCCKDCEVMTEKDEKGRYIISSSEGDSKVVWWHVMPILL